MRLKSWGLLGLAGVGVLALAMAGCICTSPAPMAPPPKPAPAVKAAPAAKPAPATFACAPAGKLEQQISPEAKLEAFTCYHADYQKKKSLHFKVALKNVSDKPQRFKVNIFLDNGKAVGGLLPPNTKKGLLEPGKSMGFDYPVQGMEDKPGEVTLIVKTLAE
ncbi:MAG: hypothetical protein V1797_07020 [Pseudomonadota bacterium]